MENLVCPKCKINYDFEVKLPRLFPNCGHTFCQECIYNLLKKKKKKYYCPKDNIKCDMAVIEKGIDYFPINLAIKNFIKPNSQSNSEQVSNQIEDSFESDQEELQSYFEDEDEIQEDSQDEFSQQNFCIHHHKKADLVCLTDRKVICSECVMFGIHKTHDYLKPEYFKQRAQKDLYDLREKAENMNPNQLSEQIIEQEKNHLISKVKYKKDMLTKEIEKNFTNLFNTLESKKKELEEDLNNHFTKFENSINYINSNLGQIFIQERELFSTFQTLENEIQKKYPDLNKLLETLYGENSLLKSSQEISTKRNQQTQNTKKLIYENLNQIQLQGSFKKLIDEIRININLETQASIEQRNTLNERRKSCIDNQNGNQNFLQESGEIQKNSFVDNMLNLNQLDDNLYNDFEIPQQENQDKSQLHQQQSMISGIMNQNSQELSMNIGDDKNDEQNILESSIIDSPILLNNNHKNDDEPSSFLKNNEGVKSFRKLSSLGRQPSNKLYSRKNSRKIFQMGSEQKIRQPGDMFQFNMDQQRKLSKEINPHKFVQSNVGFFHNNTLYGNKLNYNQQNSMMMTSEANVSKITQKQVRSNTQKKFGHSSQRNFYNQPPHQPRVIKRDFSGRGISESDLDIYVREVLEDPYIRILDLSNNNITVKGFKYLIQKLGNNKSIEFLDLKGNKIDDKAVIILEKFGKKLTTLKKINIQKNKMTTSNTLKKKYLDKLKKKGIKVNLIL